MVFLEEFFFFQSQVYIVVLAFKAMTQWGITIRDNQKGYGLRLVSIENSVHKREKMRWKEEEKRT
jgi:hypothetical protein